MGSISSYHCPTCKTKHSLEGGAGSGMLGQAAVQTFYCSECKNLFDSSPKLSGQPCKKCSTGIIREWNEGDPCPKCGGEIKNLGVEVMWD